MIHKAVYTTDKKLIERVSTELVDTYQFRGHFQVITMSTKDWSTKNDTS